MATERRQYTGGAAATTLSSGINNSTTSIPVTAGSTYPDGSVGPFFICIDRGLATEEKIKCSSRSGNTITASTRGADNTSAQAHNSGAAVEHVLTADDINIVNLHAAATGQDDHTQYLNTTRHDVEARHTFGAAFGTPATPTTVAIGTAAASGSGDNPAKEDHAHAFTGGLLAITHYQAGTGYTMNSTTLADVDSTNLSVAFTAPANGKVLVRLTGNVEPMNGGTASQMFFGLREAAATVTNSEQSVTAIDSSFGTTSHVKVSSAHYVTGLVAASAHTYKWAWKRASGGGTIGLRSGSTDPLTIEVWAAP